MTITVKPVSVKDNVLAASLPPLIAINAVSLEFAGWAVMMTKDG